MSKYKINSVWEDKNTKIKVRIVGKSHLYIKIINNNINIIDYKQGSLIFYSDFKKRYQLALCGVLDKL